jgi:NAD(P)-dependent dehydrogenase (short-subunit alcohol dehydrogenase family)
MKNLVITGASSGIGHATAAVFHEAGYNVINLSRRSCSVTGVTNIACDLSKPNFHKDIAEPLSAQVSEAEQITLIHNAALLANDSVSTTDPDEFRHILEINLVAPNSLNNLLIPHMGAGSSILYVGSTLGEKAVPNSFSYVTSKHASIGMMRSTCQDLAGTNIHTACINPGFTDTEMLREHIPADVMPQIAAMSAFERLIRPEEIARALLFAAQSPVLNGATINANLGQVER